VPLEHGAERLRHPRLGGDLGEGAVLHRLDDSGRNLRVLGRLEERHDLERRLLEPHRHLRRWKAGRVDDVRPAHELVEVRRAPAEALGEGAGDEARAARGARVPELAAGRVVIEGGAVLRRREGARVVVEPPMEPRGRRVAEVEAGVHVAGEGVLRERIAGLVVERDEADGLEAPALALDEEAPEERGRGAAVEAIAVIEEVELHRRRNVVTRAA
jgi:hypothetical protein